MGVLEAFLSTWSQARNTFGEGAPQAGDHFDQSPALQRMQTTVAAAAPGSGWVGQAATAYGTANTEHGKVFTQLAGLDKRLAEQVTGSAHIVDTGRRNLDAVKQWVVDAAASVPPGKNHEQQLMPIVQKGLTQLKDVVTTSNTALNRVGGIIEGIKGEYAALGDQRFGEKKSPLEDVLNGESPPGESNPADMQDLVRRALAGDQQAAAEVNQRLNGINDDQLGPNSAAHPLDPTQNELVGQLQAQMKPMSMDDLNAARDRLGDNKGMLANAMQVMSNPNVSYGRHDGNDLGFNPTDPTAGPPARSTEAGNTGALPDGVQKTLSLGGNFDGPPAPQAGYPGSGPADYDGGARHEASEGLKSLSNIVGDGDTRFQQGTDLDRGMMNSAKEFLHSQTGGPDGQEHWGDDVVQRVFETAGNDKVVDHDMFTSDKDFTHDVLTHEWSDNGKSASTLTDWISHDAYSTDPAVNARAGETASAIAGYMGDPTNKDALMNISGASEQNISMGKLNPDLAQSLAHAMSPYIDDMAGRDLDGTKGWQPMDGQSDLSYPHAANMYGVLGTDGGAAAILDGRSSLVQAEFVDKYAQSVIDHNGPVDNSAMETAGRVKGIAEQGAYLSELDQESDAGKARQDAYNRISNNYDTVKDAISALPFAGDVLNVQGDILKDALIGAPPPEVTPGHAPIVGSEAMRSALAATFIVNGVGDPGTLATYLNESGDKLLIPEDGPNADAHTIFENAVDDYFRRLGDGVTGPLGTYDQAYRDVNR